MAFVFEIVREEDKAFYNSFEFFERYVSDKPLTYWSGLTDWVIDRENQVTFLCTGQFLREYAIFYAMSFFDKPKELVRIQVEERLESCKDGRYDLIYDLHYISMICLFSCETKWMVSM